MSFVHYMSSYFKRGLSLLVSAFGTLVGLAFMLSGLRFGQMGYFYFGIAIIVLTTVSVKYFYWKHKVHLHAGNTYRTTYRRY